MAMKRATQLVVFTSAIVLAIAGNCAGQGRATPSDQIEGRPNASQPRPTLVGPWKADSVSMQVPGGGRKTLTDTDQPVSLIFAEKTCVLRTGTNVITEMSYSLDTKPDPWTIDMKSKEGELLGICALKVNKLQISLDDAATGRPRDFDQQKHGLVLVLLRVRGASLVVMNSDGSHPHAIVTMPDFTFVGSPRWSHDGRKIAFDGWRGVMGEGTSDAHIFVVKADGSDLKDLGPGALPSWSPDDKQIAICRYSPARGIFIMNADGSDARQIDSEGWGSQWSPARNEIAYTVYEGNGAALCIYDLAKHERRKLEHKAYQQIYWGIAWSPDGDSIAFKGILSDGGNEIAAISAKGENEGLKVLLPKSAKPEIDNSSMTLSWGGGKQILACMQKKSDRRRVLYIFDAAGDKPPRLFPNFPASWTSDNAAWSFDGKQVVMSAHAVEPPAKKAQPKRVQSKKSQ
jgi:uncharacterized protein (TIGR03067 family)